jgi:hypothetical protein
MSLRLRGTHLRALLHEPCIVHGVYRWFRFSEESTQQHDGRTVIDICGRLVNVNRTHHPPDMTSG